MSSFYPRKQKNKIALYIQTNENGRRVQKPFPENQWPDIGFKKTNDLEQARAQIREINKKNSLKRKAASKFNAAQRLNRQIEIQSLYTPSDDINEFKERVKNEYFGSDKYKNKIICHVEFVAKMVHELKLFPEDFRTNEKQIYCYFRNKRISVDYSRKIISMLNRWGEFYSWKRGAGARYLKVKYPRGTVKFEIEKAQKEATGKKRAATPINFEDIENFKKYIGTDKANWLFVALAFGLRPEELERTINNPEFYLDERTGGRVLVVDQLKLKNVADTNRIKNISVKYPEQELAREILLAGEIKKPTYKDLKMLPVPGVGLYSGRKGFTDWLISQRVPLEEISTQLGHHSLSTSWEFYKQKNFMRHLKKEKT